MTSKKTKKQGNGEVKEVKEVKKVEYNIDPKVLARVKKKLREGTPIDAEEFTQVLAKTAKDFRERTMDAGKTALEYTSALVGVNQASLNSYYFMSFHIMNKDMTNKIHPYVAFTNALVHALNLGYYLGGLDFDERPVTSDTTKPARRGRGSKKSRKRAPAKKARGKK